MKTAVCISGQPRCWEKGYDSIYNNIIKPNNADVFIHAWYQQSPDELKDYLSVYKPKAELCEKDWNISLRQNYKIIDPNHPPYRVVSLLKSRWSVNNLKLGFENENNFIYDWVVHLRSDLNIINCYDFKLLDNNFLYLSNRWESRYDSGVACDFFAFSNSRYMNIFFNTYSHIDEEYNAGINIGGEDLLGRQLNKYIPRNTVKFVHCDISHLFRDDMIKFRNDPRSGV